MPVTNKPRPEPALEAAARLIAGLGLAEGTVTLLHVGEDDEMPEMKLPSATGWHWQTQNRAGDPEEIILQAATEVSADLIMMTTDGPDGFLDGLRGTTSERVLRKAHCPVACLPVGSSLG